ncbi:MAG: hypothetical protein WBN02_03990 [Sedimenticolaceae bacterium]
MRFIVMARSGQGHRPVIQGRVEQDFRTDPKDTQRHDQCLESENSQHDADTYRRHQQLVNVGIGGKTIQAHANHKQNQK